MRHAAAGRRLHVAASARGKGMLVASRPFARRVLPYLQVTTCSKVLTGQEHTQLHVKPGSSSFV